MANTEEIKTDSMRRVQQIVSSLNMAYNTQWIVDIPLKQIDSSVDLKNFTMNIVSFTLNRLGLGMTTQVYNGVEIQMPNGSEDSDKQFTIEYKLSSNYTQYLLLMKWWQKNLKVINRIQGKTKAETEKIEQENYFYTDVNLYLLDENKDPVMLVTYKDCWLKELGELQLNYEEGENILRHSFTCYFNNYTITSLQ